MSSGNGRTLRSNEFTTSWVDIEKWLSGWSVPYSYLETVKIDRIDLMRSQRNQARIGDVIDKATVERYAQAMLNGDEFPPIVVWRGPENKYVVIDGNHRLQAAIVAKNDAIAAFLLGDGVKPQVITAMTFEANVRHGKQVSEAERIHHALWLTDNGMSLGEAGRRLNLSASALRKAKAEQEANRRADSAGIDRRVWDRIPYTPKMRLSAISTDEGFVDAVRLAHEAGMGAMEVQEMVAHINDTRSASRQRAYVKELRAGYADQIAARKAGDTSGMKGVRTRSPKTAWSSAVGMLLALPPVGVLSDSLSDPEREAILDRVEEAVKFLTVARDQLGGH